MTLANGETAMHDIESHLRLATDLGPGERRDAIAKAGRDRAARTVLGLTRLLEQRPELRGVHAPADFAAEAVRWSA
jgi:hypothetical protein